MNFPPPHRGWTSVGLRPPVVLTPMRQEAHQPRQNDTHRTAETVQRNGASSDADNRWLREAFENRVPIIYFLGIAPGRYQAILPAFIGGWDRSSKRARITFGLPGQNSLTPPATEIERRYALQTVKQRLHQASFREAVIGA